ncbi:MAG: hypothetical protein EKK55_23535 [Rhodocyclaceae bacterium]|nr:MAG: hypothetical protein EKK55_23535 [Rhodocyclaceae bacterium]
MPMKYSSGANYKKTPKKQYSVPGIMDDLTSGSANVGGGGSASDKAREFIERFQNRKKATQGIFSGGNTSTIGSSGTGASGRVSAGGAESIGSGSGSGSGGGSVSAAAVPNGSTGGYGSSAGIDSELTGWAAGLKPDMINTLMNDPGSFLRQIAYGMGLDPDQSIGAMQAAMPYVENMNELALIMLGTDPNYETGDLNSVYNWAGNFASQGMTPGGDYIDFSQGLNNLLGANTGGENLNPLESYLAINDPQGQVDAMYSLLRPLAMASLNPLWGAALLAEAGRQGDAWVSKSAGNNMEGTFGSFFRDRMGY